MMNNLFSMFDPSSSLASMSWMIMIPTILLLKNKHFSKKSKTSKTAMKMMTYMKKEMNQLMEKSLKYSSTMVTKTFMIILVMNMMAIFPFNFTPTAHLSISFTLSMSMWMSIMMYGWVMQFKNMMTHLTPLGTPNNLMNFMVLIEMVSALIRPITLSIRLSANMVAGHLLLSLLSNFSLAYSSKTMASYIPMMALIMLEMMVAIVQAYVLTTLMTLYQNETNQ